MNFINNKDINRCVIINSFISIKDLNLYAIITAISFFFGEVF